MEMATILDCLPDDETAHQERYGPTDILGYESEQVAEYRLCLHPDIFSVVKDAENRLFRSIMTLCCNSIPVGEGNHDLKISSQYNDRRELVIIATHQFVQLEFQIFSNPPFCRIKQINICHRHH